MVWSSIQFQNEVLLAMDKRRPGLHVLHGTQMLLWFYIQFQNGVLLALDKRHPSLHVLHGTPLFCISFYFNFINLQLFLWFDIQFKNGVLLAMDKRRPSLHMLHGTSLWYRAHATLKRHNERGCRWETCCDTERYSLQPVILAIADCSQIVYGKWNQWGL